MGTLDSLVGSGEELARLDPLFEAAVTRLVGSLKSLLDGDMEQLRGNLLINESITWPWRCIS